MERQQSRRTMWLATAFLDYQEACRSRTTYGRSCGIRSVITSSSRVTECMLSSTRISSSCEWASQGTSENRTLEFMHAWIRERFSEETTHTKRMRNTTKIWRKILMCRSFVRWMYTLKRSVSIASMSEALRILLTEHSSSSGRSPVAIRTSFMQMKTNEYFHFSSSLGPVSFDDREIAGFPIRIALVSN